MTKHEIDERALTAAIAAAADCGWMFEKPLHRADMAAIIRAYLAALPEPQPARDRIAVVVGLDECEAMVLDGESMNDAGWEWLGKCIGPAVRVIVRCNLPRPATPIEVDGSVEVVT